MESISGGMLDFQEILHVIDSVLSKFDPSMMGSSTNRPVLVLDQAECQNSCNVLNDKGFISKKDEKMISSGSPHEIDRNTREWKRVVWDWVSVQTQTMPTQKKRMIRDVEGDNVVLPSRKKLCATDTNQKPTVEATGQPHRNQ